MNSIRSFLAEIVDYAGLFPPAGLDMETAVRNYAEYRSGSECDLLGRFVVPVTRLDEFSAAARRLLERGDGGAPWRLSMLVGDDVESARETMLEFNLSHANGSELGMAVCDTVELQARRDADIAEAVLRFPRDLRLFFEIASDSDPSHLIASVGRHSAGAKIRTGGVTRAAFPRASDVARFIAICVRVGVPFKATAGLHHALRSTYPFTYDPESERGEMFGYLNLFLAAGFVRKGISEATAVELLEEESRDAFSFSDDGVAWRGNALGTADLRETRALARSFGSCSFREPVEEAKALGFI